ncbi:MAG: YidC/Oxa1 family membrane protein insertase [Selenomonadaceae bacterium]|nr:YidC/Oxa1 family membrane protein insertase [Selenomonadaceae bacterium]
MNVALTGLYSITEMFGMPSYGLAIILLTVLVKILVYPLTKKQFKSMKAMQRLQPEMKKLQEKYKKDPKVMQQKMMELYQKEDVNPMSGCLPMLIQMPILMGMYYTLFNLDYGGAAPSFMWLPSLSEPDPYYVLPLLAALTTFLPQKMMSTTTEQNPQMKIMMIIMPIFIGWISLSFPAGLVLYWVTMNVVQIVQQWWVNRQDDDKEVA